MANGSCEIELIPQNLRTLPKGLSYSVREVQLIVSPFKKQYILAESVKLIVTTVTCQTYCYNYLSDL